MSEIQELEQKEYNKLDTLLNHEDDTGNKLVFDKGNVYLKLANEDSKRKIGQIQILKNEARIYKKYEDTKNIMRINNSWSIHHEILNHVDYILYETATKEYGITAKEAQTKGEFFNFRQSGYEKKIYVPLDYWTITSKKASKKSSSDKREEKFRNLMGDEWYEKLEPEINSEEFKKFAKWVADRRKEVTVYPNTSQIFRAYYLTPYSSARVVILGQDPYHNGVADGLAFSSNDPNYLPKSLDIIQNELQKEFDKFYFPVDSELSYLAHQGVFLLNTILTVEKGKAGSHKNMGWEKITSKTVEWLNKKPEPIVFMLWGKYAKEYEQYLDSNYHLVLKAPHPMAEQYSGGNAGFYGCNHFIKANEFLRKNYNSVIDW